MLLSHVFILTITIFVWVATPFDLTASTLSQNGKHVGLGKYLYDRYLLQHEA